jgi:hypothetical protein
VQHGRGFSFIVFIYSCKIEIEIENAGGAELSVMGIGFGLSWP